MRRRKDGLPRPLIPSAMVSSLLRVGPCGRSPFRSFVRIPLTQSPKPRRSRPASANLIPPRLSLGYGRSYPFDDDSRRSFDFRSRRFCRHLASRSRLNMPSCEACLALEGKPAQIEPHQKLARGLSMQRTDGEVEMYTCRSCGARLQRLVSTTAGGPQHFWMRS